MIIEDTSEYAGVIYGLHNGDFDYRYIGQTVKPIRTRFKSHLSSAKCGAALPVYNWMRKHGPENIQVCVIETFDEETIHLIDEREIFHIAQYRHISTGKNMNVADGGDGTKGFTHSAETRAKMSTAQIGKKTSEATKAKLSAAQIGNQNLLGHKHSEETKAKQRVAAQNRSPEAHAKSTHTRWHVARNLTNPDCNFCKESA